MRTSHILNRRTPTTIFDGQIITVTKKTAAAVVCISPYIEQNGNNASKKHSFFPKYSCRICPILGKYCRRHNPEVKKMRKEIKREEGTLILGGLNVTVRRNT